MLGGAFARHRLAIGRQIVNRFTNRGEALFGHENVDFLVDFLADLGVPQRVVDVMGVGFLDGDVIVGRRSGEPVIVAVEAREEISGVLLAVDGGAFGSVLRR